MKWIYLVLILGMMYYSASLQAQQITLKKQQISLLEAFKEIKKQTNFNFMWAARNVQNSLKVSINVQSKSVEQTVAELLKGLPLQFKIEDKTIMIYEKKEQNLSPQPKTREGQEAQMNSIIRSQASRVEQHINGRVTSLATGEPLTGVTVTIKGKNFSVTTSDIGFFNFRDIEMTEPITLQFRSIGMKTLEVPWDKSNLIHIRLEQEIETIKEAVVTGMFQRKKESFTGSAATYTARELKMVGVQNVLQSLKTLDPSFRIVDNNLFGSDPNRLPDIEINGKSSVIGLNSEYGTNPNQPLFILDGFESTLAIVSNLSMERIESITLLKDAAAAAIYGSKAANGVVVVETKRPIPGKLRVSYSFSGAVAVPDLTDYNLMNAREKLEFERLAGVYGTFDNSTALAGGMPDLEKRYYSRLKGVVEGVDSYWLAEPLRVGHIQKHDLSVTGGDQNLTYMLSLFHNNEQGVMKHSARNITNGRAQLTYRKGKISFTNGLTIEVQQADREPVSFARFAQSPPYFKKYLADGSIPKILNANNSLFSGEIFTQFNPIYDFENRNSNREGINGFTNNFQFIYYITNNWELNFKLGLRKDNIHQEIFRSPFNTEFYEAKQENQGKYTQVDGNSFNYDGSLNLSYRKIIKEKSALNFTLGMRLDQLNSFMSGYDVYGFADEEFVNPAFALGYAAGTTARYQDSKRRSASFFGQTNYTYDNRFLTDISLRWDGASVYGSEKQFTAIWSAGLGWNLHNEQLLPFADWDWLGVFKIRGSIGNPGNQNFNDYISSRIYSYNLSDRNLFGPGVVVSGGGNPNLRWQKTLNKNIGFELKAFQGKLSLEADYVHKLTDPLLVHIDMPTSTGIDRMPQNMGKQLTTGGTVNANYVAIQKTDFMWRLMFNANHFKSVYKDLGSSLENLNTTNKSRNLVRYYDNGSPNDLWAVRSLGIDPATGREVFLNKDNQQTFVHSFDDEVVVGNSEAKISGVIGTYLMYKGFSLGAFVRFRYGGQEFLRTLYDKVENISSSTVYNNLDRRAYYDRWKQPGDVVQFKSLDLLSSTPISSRFVKNNNQLVGESFSLAYETSNKLWLNKVGLASLRVSAYMNDIFYVSSILNERGLDYPFARTITFGLNLGFK